jgi:hypothetical protein
MSNSIKKNICTETYMPWQGSAKEQRQEFNKEARAKIKLQLRNLNEDPFVAQKKRTFKVYVYAPAYFDEFVKKVIRK